MKNKNKITVLLILCCVFMITGCKPEKDIVGEIMPLASEYKKQPIMEYFEFQDKLVIVSNSEKLRNDEASIGEVRLLVKGMVLKYYPEDKKAYGKYYIRRYLDPENEIEEIPVMLDINGYHVQEGYELTKEIKDFKFMFEEVSFSQEYFKTLKIKESDYDFEVPSYSVTYLLADENKDLVEYLGNNNLLKHGSGYSIEFSKKGNYYDGGEVELKIEKEGEAYILESFNYGVSEKGIDYKGQFLGEESVKNE
ncbi:tandem-type lipoprotein [Isobaculum melis]|uniref:Lipoprotein n=1 Tax=Isobaculum melis TaxID=142588 RepID=A0A1H9PUS0_9LACT|nr:hypothetical protein [Isobaculum melis]SER51961.1 hypothetical protein SAMN04488559_101153 [Isobaculum melis]